MIKNQWYAIMASEQIPKGKVVSARRFGENLVLFRRKDETLACVTGLCAHRGASLGKGCLSNGNIRCPFHGIEYDITGKCVYIPSNGRSSKADYSRFNLRYYELREIGNIVFAWYGDGVPDKEPDYFEIITDNRFTYDQVDDMWGVQYSRVIENQLDVSHLAFVHRTTIGRGNRKLVNGPKVVWTNENTLMTSADNEVDVGQTPKDAENSTIKCTNLNFKFPNMWLNHVSDKIQILAYFVPVDEEHSIISLRFYNRITGNKAIDKAIAWLGSRANTVIERQDKRVVETQLPKISALKSGENLVAADRPIVEYRSRRDLLQRAGITGKETDGTFTDGGASIGMHFTDGRTYGGNAFNEIRTDTEGAPGKENGNLTAGKAESTEYDAKVKHGRIIWKCSVCGYEYVGDELPEGFICPVCSRTAAEFEKTDIG